MNITSKTILTSTLFTALLVGTSANAEGRAGGLTDYADNSVVTESVTSKSDEMKKVNFKAPSVEKDDTHVNR